MQFSERVYHINSDKDKSVLIGMGIEIENEWIRWFDSVKQRRMKIGEILDENPKHFVFQRAEDDGGGTYTFVPLSLEIYNEKVKKRILISQDFTDQEAMLAAFEKTRENAW